MFDYCYWIVAFALLWATISTYWDWLFDFDNYHFHGLCIGLAMIPLVGLGYDWKLIIARSIVLFFAMGYLYKLGDIDWFQEMGRGALIILTLPILLI